MRKALLVLVSTSLTLMPGLCAAAQTAQECVERAASVKPEPAINTVILSIDRMLRAGDESKALILVNDAIAAHPDNALLEDALGRVVYRSGDLVAAVKAFNASIKLGPCNERAHYDAWRVDATAGFYQDAQRQLEIAHSVAPGNKLIERLWSNTQLAPPVGVIVDDPPHFNFYARHLDCEGIPIRAAAVVNPAALPATCAHISRMLAHIPNVRANLIARGAEMHLIGEDQVVSDLPEFRMERGEHRFARLNTETLTMEAIDIDAHAGATGGIYANCLERNVLHLVNDGYGIHQEVCIHEFAHDIMNAGFDAGMRAEIAAQYKISTNKGLWTGAYAATNPNEWWAEISTWYFGAQGGTRGMLPPMPAPGPDALKAYDPDAFALADRFYSGAKQPHTVRMHEARVVRSITLRNMPFDPAELLLINNTAGRLKVYFVSAQGEPREFATVEPYSRQLLRGYTNEFLEVVDARARSRTLLDVTDTESEASFNDAPRPQL